MDWQRKISAAEAGFRGFRGHKVERPVQGITEDWTIVLSFDTEDNLVVDGFTGAGRPPRGG